MADNEYKPEVVSPPGDTIADLLEERGWTPAILAKRLRCYVLVGYPKDTFEAAEQRLHQTIEAGFIPMAMLYRGRTGSPTGPEWKQFQRLWARPALIQSST